MITVDISSDLGSLEIVLGIGWQTQKTLNALFMYVRMYVHMC